MNPDPNKQKEETMIEYREYHLQKYKGRATRHECPRCHDQHSFAYYVDDDGNIIDKVVGRCNHESSCGYHYAPKEWFKDNQHDQPQRDRVNRVQADINPRDPDFIDPDFVLRSASLKSDLVYYLCGLIPADTIKRVWGDYGVGATKDKSVIYWQIDTRGKVRTGKVMKYDPETGHRVKGNGGVNWVHSILKKRGLLPDSFNFVQCLFGERLMKMNPDKGVALVESEKTALIGSALFPQYVWLATGGKSQMSVEKMRVLVGRRVVAFPDVDGFQEWKRKAAELSGFGINISVSDVLERKATPEERQRKIDIADWMLEQLETTSKEQMILSRMIQAHPCLGVLVRKLDLEIVS